VRVTGIPVVRVALDDDAVADLETTLEVAALERDLAAVRGQLGFQLDPPAGTATS